MSHRIIEIIFSRRSQPVARSLKPVAPSGPTAALYRWALGRLGLRTTITTLLRRWQYSEPLVWLLAIGTAGTWLGHAGDARNLLWLGAVRRRRIIGLLSAPILCVPRFAALLRGLRHAESSTHLFWGPR